MALWEWLLDGAGVVLVLVLLLGACLVVRRRLIARHGGTFELSYRVRSDRAGRGWLLGVGRYSGETLECFRIFSLAPRPRQTWNRRELHVRTRREPDGVEQVALYAGHVVVVCDTPDGEVELAMAPASLMGFQAWLEAKPPGTVRIV